MADPETLTPPAAGAPGRTESEIAPGEEPVATGTLFLMIVMLMIIGGIWWMLYLTLLSR
ncbi:MAG TPA: hypothetical protein VFJ16_26410 [Longimicrobium sp.]|nr:hypothetical protein [Longimicrobium sp.]